MRKRITAAALFLLGMVCLLLLPGQIPVQADQVKYFDGEVSVLKETENSFVFQVDVTNSGEDFEGLVRLRFNGMPDNGSCSYEQELSLPAGGQKQYRVSVPLNNIQQSKGSGSISFVNNKGKTLQTITFKDLLGGKISGIQVGILSDDYDSLTYLDLGGETYALGSVEKPIRLEKLDKDKTAAALDGLYFLVIDHYDTSVLDKETVAAIEKWVENGGCLILGTGAYAKETLAGFEKNFLDVSVKEISEPGEENPASVRASNNTGNYYVFGNQGISLKEMAVASVLDNSGNSYELSDYPGLCFDKNKGSVLVLSISLGETEMQKAKKDSAMGRVLFDNCAISAGSLGDMGEWIYQGQKAFATIDQENTKVSFSFPKMLMLIYVILIGPVLYLILKAAKKREWYWICVPVCALVFVGILFLFGQSVKINRTNLYSVSVQQASGKEEEPVETYYRGYHSGVKPWSVALTDGYTFAGAGLTEMNGSGNTGEKDRYVVNYGEKIRLGMNPVSNFETGYLYAAGTKPGKGTIETKNLVVDSNNGTFSGTIENHTAYDFPYLYVRSDQAFMAIKDVKAKETIDLAAIRGSKRLVYESQYADDVFYDFLDVYGNKRTQDDNDQKSALMIGMYAANRYREEGEILVCGLVPGYEKTVTGKCREISFGCLYTTAEQEVSNAAN